MEYVQKSDMAVWKKASKKNKDVFHLFKSLRFDQFCWSIWSGSGFSLETFNICCFFDDLIQHDIRWNKIVRKSSSSLRGRKLPCMTLKIEAIWTLLHLGVLDGKISDQNLTFSLHFWDGKICPLMSLGFWLAVVP